MQYENPIKFGYTRNIDVNVGAGLDQDITYTSSNPALVEVSPVGVVKPLSAPTEVTRVIVAAKDAYGVVRASFAFDILPVGHVIDPRYDLINVGNAAHDMRPMPFTMETSVGAAVADEEEVA